ncbi:hypothetical protein Tco_0809497 [Tanacetum coccineum]
MTSIEISSTALKSELSSLRKDTLKIKSMMTEIYHAFKGQSSSAPSSSVTPTLALTNILANVKGENATNTATEELPSHTKGETEYPKMVIPIYYQSNLLKIDKGKEIVTESDEDPSKELVPASTIVPPDPDEEDKVPYMINGKMCYLTNTEMQAYLDKDKKLKKAAEEARLFAISMPKVIKVVQEEAEKIGLDLEKIASAKACEKFKKAQDAEHQVLKREHSQKVKRLTELNKKRAEQYIWTMTNKIKLEPITDFTDFGITELDELCPIIQKKNNSIVKDLMTSLSKRYERLKKILEELGIQYALLAPVPEQALSQTSGRKRAEYGIFFLDVFGNQAFQRWNDIRKVGADSLISDLVMA